MGAITVAVIRGHRIAHREGTARLGATPLRGRIVHLVEVVADPAVEAVVHGAVAEARAVVVEAATVVVEATVAAGRFYGKKGRPRYSGAVPVCGGKCSAIAVHERNFGTERNNNGAPKPGSARRVLSSRSDSHDTAPACLVNMVVYGNMDREYC
jgi:hypothetical protein